MRENHSGVSALSADIVERLETKHENRENPYAYQEAIEAYEKDREEAADEIRSLRRALQIISDWDDPDNSVCSYAEKTLTG
jgi:hypothetical protein